MNARAIQQLLEILEAIEEDLYNLSDALAGLKKNYAAMINLMEKEMKRKAKLYKLPGGKKGK